MIIEAESVDEIERRLRADPWSRMALLTVTSVEPWQILLDRGAATQPG
jgi:uncharacterized protein YciI